MRKYITYVSFNNDLFSITELNEYLLNILHTYMDGSELHLQKNTL